MALLDAGNRGSDLAGQHLLLGGGSWDVDVGVIVHLVTLPHVLDDVKVRTGGFRQAVFQYPTVNL